MQGLRDRFGRSISYLRLSVTDRCDFRCFYCLPRSHRDFEAPKDWLTPTEIERLVSTFATLGVHHVRLTGGEPLVRRELLDIAQRIKGIDGVDELSLSTNASRLAGFAAPLRQAGVARVNISLDSLDPHTFRQMTGGELSKVLAGIEAAREAGLHPIKINMVVMKGLNDHEVEAICAFCMERDLTLRLIETMPVGASGRDANGYYLDLRGVEDRLRKSFGLQPAAMRGSGPARYFRIQDSGLVVGFITPQSQHFCESCNRVRLATGGTLYLCLGQENRLELRPLLRNGIGDEELRRIITDAVLSKPERHEFTTRPAQIIRPMSALGG